MQTDGAIEIPKDAFNGLIHWNVYVYCQISSNTIRKEVCPEDIVVTLDVANKRLSAQRKGKPLVLADGSSKISLREILGNEPISFFVARSKEGILVGVMTDQEPRPIAQFRIREAPPKKPADNELGARIYLVAGKALFGGVAVSTYAKSMEGKHHWLIVPDRQKDDVLDRHAVGRTPRGTEQTNMLRRSHGLGSMR